MLTGCPQAATGVAQEEPLAWPQEPTGGRTGDVGTPTRWGSLGYAISVAQKAIPVGLCSTGGTTGAPARVAHGDAKDSHLGMPNGCEGLSHGISWRLHMVPIGNPDYENF